MVAEKLPLGGWEFNSRYIHRKVYLTWNLTTILYHRIKGPKITPPNALEPGRRKCMLVFKCTTRIKESKSFYLSDETEILMPYKWKLTILVYKKTQFNRDFCA